MLGNKNRMLLQSIKTFVARDARQKLQKIVEKAHPADLGLVFGHLRISEARKVLELLSGADLKARVLSETGPELVAELLREFSPKEISSILKEMYSDDCAFILERFEEELRHAILKEMGAEESAEVEKRLQYDEDTAGRIMVPDFLALPADSTVAEAIAALRKAKDIELVYYLYVISEAGQLVGVVSLRQLLLVDPTTHLRDIMIKDLITVRVHDDQEDVARRVARYNLVAIPVVDDLGKMLGIITVDDVIDVIKEEATEDMLMMAGASVEDQLVNAPVAASVRARSLWLLASCMGGLIAFALIQRLGGVPHYGVLLAFIPLVMGLGGNVGTQSATLVARGLATNIVDSSSIGKVMLKEGRIGGLLGLGYGSLVALMVALLYAMGGMPSWAGGGFVLASSAGLGVFLSMAAASVVGSLVPLALDRLRIDPVIATGPLVTSVVDVLGVLVYLLVGTALLGP